MAKTKGIMIGCGFFPSHSEMQQAFQDCMQDVRGATDIEFNRLEVRAKKLTMEEAKTVYKDWAKQQGWPIPNRLDLNGTKTSNGIIALVYPDN